MIEVIVAVCLLGEPERCKDVHLTFAEPSVTPQQCMMHGQGAIADWLASNPGWAPKRWSCGRVRDRLEAKA